MIFYLYQYPTYNSRTKEYYYLSSEQKNFKFNWIVFILLTSTINLYTYSPKKLKFYYKIIEINKKKKVISSTSPMNTKVIFTSQLLSYSLRTIHVKILNHLKRHLEMQNFILSTWRGNFTV